MIPPQRSADFAAAMGRVLDVYRRPYDPAFPVVCMDETPRQLIRETRVPIPSAPGRALREDYEYRRCGTCNVFMATEPLAGWRMTKVTAHRTKIEWVHFLNDIATRHPDAERITLVMDNLNTHRPGISGLAPNLPQSCSEVPRGHPIRAPRRPGTLRSGAASRQSKLEPKTLNPGRKCGAGLSARPLTACG